MKESTYNLLLSVGAKLFATKGYHQTSTREISAIAGTNNAAIAYNFGNKAGLYHAIIECVLAEIPETQLDWDEIVELSCRDKLYALFQWLPIPTSGNELLTNAFRLILLERIQPSGVCDNLLLERILPRFSIVTQLVAHELGLSEVDYDAKILSLAILSMRSYFSLSPEIVTALLPSLLEDEAHADYLMHRLADFASSMITQEKLRRGQHELAAAK